MRNSHDLGVIIRGTDPGLLAHDFARVIEKRTKLFGVNYRSHRLIIAVTSPKTSTARIKFRRIFLARLLSRFVAPRLQIAADMRPRRRLARGQNLRGLSGTLFQDQSSAKYLRYPSEVPFIGLRERCHAPAHRLLGWIPYLSLCIAKEDWVPWLKPSPVAGPINSKEEWCDAYVGVECASVRYWQPL